MEKKSKLWIRSVYYYLKRCMEARFSQITTSGETLESRRLSNGVYLITISNILKYFTYNDNQCQVNFLNYCGWVKLGST